MLLLTFSWKTFFIFNFSLFLNNAGKSSTPFMEFLFPCEKFLYGKIFPCNPRPPHSTREKSPLETSVCIPVTNPQGIWGIKSSSTDIVIRFLDYAEQIGYLKILILWLWERSLVALYFLLKGTRTLNFHSNGPSRSMKSPPREKKKNKHPSVIILLAKNTKFHILADRSLKPQL